MKTSKIVVLGSEAVGKTSLLYRFVYNTFKTSYKATLGVDVLKKTIEDLDVELSLWDFSGQKIFEKLRTQYYSEAEGALLVFDVTRRETFEAVNTWLDEAKTHTGDDNLPIIVLANKTDLKPIQEVFDKQMEELSIKIIKTSAKTGENVEKAFRDIATSILGN
ncbi:MAG: Rab family GTPase [Promethearchaeota archaeon]